MYSRSLAFIHAPGHYNHYDLVILQKGEPMTKDEVQAIIDEVDENGDGKLDYKEVSADRCRSNLEFHCNLDKQ